VVHFIPGRGVYCLCNAVKVSLTDLTPDMVYKIQVAAATESIVSRNEYFIGPYSSVQKIRTLGEWEFMCFVSLFDIYVSFIE